MPTCSRRFVKLALGWNASDDDILGLTDSAADSSNREPADLGGGNRGRENNLDIQLVFDFDTEPVPDLAIQGKGAGGRSRENANGGPKKPRVIFDANPELRRDYQDARSYRESFSTPEDARGRAPTTPRPPPIKWVHLRHKPNSSKQPMQRPSKTVIDASESQVERPLPDGFSKNARTV